MPAYGRTRCPRRGTGGAWSIVCDGSQRGRRSGCARGRGSASYRQDEDTAGLRAGQGVREVRDGEEGVLVEDLAVKEPLQEVPRHWCWRALGKQQRIVRGWKEEGRRLRRRVRGRRNGCNGSWGCDEMRMPWVGARHVVTTGEFQRSRTVVLAGLGGNAAGRGPAREVQLWAWARTRSDGETSRERGWLHIFSTLKYGSSRK